MAEDYEFSVQGFDPFQVKDSNEPPAFDPAWVSWGGRAVFSLSLAALFGASVTGAAALGAMALSMPWVAVAIVISGVIGTGILAELIFQELTEALGELGASQGSEASGSSLPFDPFCGAWNEDWKFLGEILAARIRNLNSEDLFISPSQDDCRVVLDGIDAFQTKEAFLHREALKEEKAIREARDRQIAALFSGGPRIVVDEKAQIEKETEGSLRELKGALDEELHKGLMKLQNLVGGHSPRLCLAVLREMLRRLPAAVIDSRSKPLLKKLAKEPSTDAAKAFWKSLERQRKECIFWVIQGVVQPLLSGAKNTPENRQRLAQLLAPALVEFDLVESSAIIDGIAALLEFRRSIGKLPLN